MREVLSQIVGIKIAANPRDMRQFRADVQPLRSSPGLVLAVTRAFVHGLYFEPGASHIVATGGFEIFHGQHVIRHDRRPLSHQTERRLGVTPDARPGYSKPWPNIAWCGLPLQAPRLV